MKKFVVGVRAESKEDEARIPLLFKLEGLGWWHWVDGMWLVSDSKGQQSAKKLRNLIITSEIIKVDRVVVLEVEPVTWASFGPSNVMTSWLRKFWKGSAD